MPERRIATRGIIEKNGRILAVKHKDTNGDEVDYWAIPGGGLDPLESLHDGLTREMIEETGITPQLGQLLFVQQYGDSSREYLEFFFHITNANDYGSIDLSKTSHGTLEIARCEFIDPQTENILPKFLQSTDITQVITASSPTHIANYL